MLDIIFIRKSGSAPIKKRGAKSGRIPRGLNNNLMYVILSGARSVDRRIWGFRMELTTISVGVDPSFSKYDSAFFVF